MKNNRLRLDPGATWRQLTVDEAHCIAEHRAAIKRLVNEPVPPPRRASSRSPTTPEPPTHPSPVSTQWTIGGFVTEQDLRDAGVVGTDRAAYERAREWLRAQAHMRRAEYTTGVMYESGRRHQRGTHGGYRE